MTAHLASRVQRHGVTLFAMTGMVLMTGAVIANGGTGRGTANGSDGTVSICHATASASNPYVAITVSVNGLNGHGGHEDDIVPAPEEGCPEDDGDDETGDDGDSDSPYGYPETVTICHATESAKNPFVEITVSVNGLNGHGDHEDDIVPAPEDGCPAGDDDEDDDDEDEKVWICHLADSQQYVLIRVSVNGLEGHGDHDGDVVPAPDEGCPTDDGEDDTVDLCHLADNQQYVPLTVSVNGLNGHGDHEGDIVPAPEEGCPDTPCVDDCPPPPCEETDTCPPPPCEETDTCPPPPCEETDTCPPPPCEETDTCEEDTPPPHHRNGNSPPAASAATPPPPPPELPPAVLDAPAAPPEPPVLPPPAEFPTLPDWTPLGSFCGWAQDLPTECGTVSLAARLISVPAGNIWVAKTENPKFTTKPKFRPHSDYHHHAHHNGELNAFQYHEF